MSHDDMSLLKAEPKKKKKIYLLDYLVLAYYDASVLFLSPTPPILVLKSLLVSMFSAIANKQAIGPAGSTGSRNTRVDNANWSRIDIPGHPLEKFYLTQTSCSNC